MPLIPFPDTDVELPPVPPPPPDPGDSSDQDNGDLVCGWTLALGADFEWIEPTYIVRRSYSTRRVLGISIYDNTYSRLDPAIHGLSISSWVPDYGLPVGDPRVGPAKYSGFDQDWSSAFAHCEDRSAFFIVVVDPNPLGLAEQENRGNDNPVSFIENSPLEIRLGDAEWIRLPIYRVDHTGPGSTGVNGRTTVWAETYRTEWLRLIPNHPFLNDDAIRGDIRAASLTANNSGSKQIFFSRLTDSVEFRLRPVGTELELIHKIWVGVRRGRNNDEERTHLHRTIQVPIVFHALSDIGSGYVLGATPAGLSVIQDSGAFRSDASNIPRYARPRSGCYAALEKSNVLPWGRRPHPYGRVEIDPWPVHLMPAFDSLRRIRSAPAGGWGEIFHFHTNGLIDEFSTLDRIFFPVEHACINEHDARTYLDALNRAFSPAGIEFIGYFNLQAPHGVHPPASFMGRVRMDPMKDDHVAHFTPRTLRDNTHIPYWQHMHVSASRIDVIFMGDQMVKIENFFGLFAMTDANAFTFSAVELIAEMVGGVGPESAIVVAHGRDSVGRANILHPNVLSALPHEVLHVLLNTLWHSHEPGHLLRGKDEDVYRDVRIGPFGRPKSWGGFYDDNEIFEIRNRAMWLSEQHGWLRE